MNQHDSIVKKSDILPHENKPVEGYKNQRYGSRSTNYALLNHGLKQELDNYLNTCIATDSERYIIDKRSSCAKFMMYLQERGIFSIGETEYLHVLEYHNRMSDCQEASKAIEESRIRMMIQYYASQNMCRFGFSIVLGRLYFHQIVLLKDFSSEHAEILETHRAASLEFPSDAFMVTVEEFCRELEIHRYSHTVLKSNRHVLTLLYVFLDMHDLGYNVEIAQAWFEEIQDLIGSAWRGWLRTLKQFDEFNHNGSINPSRQYRYRKHPVESLPAWCRLPLVSYLHLREREGMTKSTITTDRSSCMRFCQFLISDGISCFKSVTPAVLTDFNKTDHHMTVEGKNAYNNRIRRFLEYLEDKGTISSTMLHKALPSMCAPCEKVVKVLSDDEVQAVESFRLSCNTPLGLRRAAVVMLGLKMGFRGSDIINIRFQDVNWKNRSITIIQQKTLTEVSLPMPISVGNAIYTYIKSGRPKSDSPYIFIRHHVPYGKLSSNSCIPSLHTVLPERNEPGSGFHVTRKTFATSLLRKGNSLQTITDLLGHRQTTTASVYLSLDEKRMRRCSLSLSDAGIPVKGGLNE